MVDTSGMDKPSCTDCKLRKPMLYIVTACALDHVKYLPDCNNSVMTLMKMLPFDVDYTVKIDEFGRGSAHIINEVISRVGNDDMFMILDADDFMLPNIVNLFHYIEDYDVVYGDRISIGKKTVVERAPEFNRKLLRKQNIIPGGCTLMRGSVLRKWPDIPHGQDWVFWRSINARFKHVPVMVWVRRSDTSTKASKIPVYRKLRRLYRNYKLRNEKI